MGIVSLFRLHQCRAAFGVLLLGTFGFTFGWVILYVSFFGGLLLGGVALSIIGQPFCTLSDLRCFGKHKHVNSDSVRIAFSFSRFLGGLLIWRLLFLLRH